MNGQFLAEAVRREEEEREIRSQTIEGNAASAFSPAAASQLETSFRDRDGA